MFCCLLCYDFELGKQAFVKRGRTSLTVRRSFEDIGEVPNSPKGAERYPEARSALEHSLAIFPDAGPSLCFLAATLALQGDLPAAAEALQELRRVWPKATAQTLSTTGAVVPPAAAARFFEGLRLAGFKSDPMPPH